jgi:hypothetical protein
MKTSNYISFDSNGGVEISVSLFTFKEGDVYIAYCPSLDLSGYDHDEAKAKADFEAMLADYLAWQMRNGTLRADLSAHGWHIGKAKGNEPPLSELLGMNEQLRTLVAGSYMKTNLNTTCALA